MAGVWSVTGSSKELAGIRTVHVTTVHPPTDTRILLKECHSLADFGAEVTLIAQDQPGWHPERVRWLPLNRAKGRLKRATITAIQAFWLATRSHAEIYHLHDPELIPWGAFLRLLGKRVIYDAHEDLSAQILVKRWIPDALKPLAQRLAAGLQKTSGTLFSAVVAATPTIAQLYPQRKTYLVQNWPLENEFEGTRVLAYEQRESRFVYVGDISMARGLKPTVEAFNLVAKEREAFLDLVGPLSDEGLQEWIDCQPSRSSISLLGRQGREVVGRALLQARAGLVLLQPFPSHIESQPTKLFEYMAAGLPVVASDFPLWHRIVEGVGCGLVVDPTHPDGIAEAMTWLLDHPAEANEMGKRGRLAVKERYNWATEAAGLVRAYRTVLA